MENQKDRQTTLGICYFVAPRTQGPEVRFPVTEPVTEPVTKKHAFPRKKAVTKPGLKWVGQGLSWVLFGGWLLFFLFSEHLMLWIGPKPSPAIMPAPPYRRGQVIKGPSTDGAVHTWVYFSNVGWVDP